MRLLLIRHAQSANNALPEEQRVEDPDITDLGHRQADALATWLASISLEHLISSPFRRSLRTTQHISRRTGMTPEVWVDLHEQGGCYSGWEPERYLGRPGMSAIEIATEFPGYRLEEIIDGQGWWKSQPYETDELARRRARRLIARTLETFSNEDTTVAFVMHADFKRLLLSELFATSGYHTNGWPRRIYNTAVTAIDFSVPAAPCLDTYNSVGHLPGELHSS